jgi:hypothetical protein
MPNANLVKHQKEVYCSEIKLFSNIAPNIKSPNNDTKMFKPALKEYLSPVSLLLLCIRIYLNQKFLATMYGCK